MLISDPFRSFDQGPAPFLSLRPGLFPLFNIINAKWGKGTNFACGLRLPLKKSLFPTFMSGNRLLRRVQRWCFSVRLPSQKACSRHLWAGTDFCAESKHGVFPSGFLTKICSRREVSGTSFRIHSLSHNSKTGKTLITPMGKKSTR